MGAANAAPKSAEPGSNALNDPQIATIALTAHEIDIERGERALRKTKNADVKQFAEQMVNDHTAGKQDVLGLAKKLNVKPQESDVSRSLKNGAKKTAQALRKLNGAAYDKAYIETEVNYHQAVIDALDNALIPNAKNAEVKDALVNTRPTLTGHLAHAKNVQALLNK
jgi:putative membrane protein